MPSPDYPSSGTIHVERWPSDLPLPALNLVAAVTIYVLLAISMVGIVCVASFALLFFVMNAAFVAHSRGSAVRLGPQQFSNLHRRAEEAR